VNKGIKPAEKSENSQHVNNSLHYPVLFPRGIQNLCNVEKTKA
jgi:hypothetical protein